MDQQKQAALVTGSAKRVGREIALALAKNNVSVICHANTSIGEAEQLADQIVKGGGVAHVICADLTDKKNLEGSENLILQAQRQVDHPLLILINNASIFFDDRLGKDFSSAQFDQHIAVNLRAPLLLSQAFAKNYARCCEEQKPDHDVFPSGNIVHIIDHRVLKPSPHFFSYSIAKAALFNATKIAAQALAPSIRVNGVGPGPTLQNIHQSDQDWGLEQHHTLLGRGSPPKDIAQAVLFLLGNDSVTGQMIAVDAGQHLNWQTPDMVGGGGGSS